MFEGAQPPACTSGCSPPRWPTATTPQGSKACAQPPPPSRGQTCRSITYPPPPRWSATSTTTPIRHHGLEGHGLGGHRRRLRRCPKSSSGVGFRPCRGDLPVSPSVATPATVRPPPVAADARRGRDIRPTRTDDRGHQTLEDDETPRPRRIGAHGSAAPTRRRAPDDRRAPQGAVAVAPGLCFQCPEAVGARRPRFRSVRLFGVVLRVSSRKRRSSIRHSSRLRAAAVSTPVVYPFALAHAMRTVGPGSANLLGPYLLQGSCP